GDARARRGVRHDQARVHGDRLRPARPALAVRDRGRGGGRMKQVVPPSITGKGSRFAEGGSVLDHAFGKSDPYTLGVEEEYMLLDAETFDLVQHIDTVLAAVSGHELEPQINPELMQSVLEVATPVCHTPADVAKQLHALRQYVARRELIFGMHVHVAVDDAEKAIQVVNGLIGHLTELVALSANSPFWRGEPTGLHSSRHMVFAALPRSGPPPRFRNYADYAEVVG